LCALLTKLCGESQKSIDACGELQRASDVRDSNEVPTSLPLSKKSAKKVIFFCIFCISRVLCLT
jgi:hypothetical protein